MAKTIFTLKQQIGCLQREIALRERLYPRWVESKKLKPESAEFELQCMKSIAERLKSESALEHDALKYMEEQGLQNSPTLFDEPNV